MTIRRFFAAALLAVVGALVGTTATVHAGGVPNHNHFLTTPGSENVVQIGPHVCDNPEVLHDAFHKFHSNVHTGAPKTVGGLSVSAVLC